MSDIIIGVKDLKKSFLLNRNAQSVRLTALWKSNHDTAKALAEICPCGWWGKLML